MMQQRKMIWLDLETIGCQTLKDGKQVKHEGKLMKTKLFEQWLLNHPRV
jgi:hypothetical protein